MTKCTICNQRIDQTMVRLGLPHTCPPIWIVQDKDWDYDPVSIRASDAKAAAIEFAESLDSENQNFIADGNEIGLVVKDVHGNATKLTITGEYYIHWSAYKEASDVKPETD